MDSLTIADTHPREMWMAIGNRHEGDAFQFAKLLSLLLIIRSLTVAESFSYSHRLSLGQYNTQVRKV